MKKGGKLLQDFDAELVATVIRFGTLCDGMRVGENSDLTFGCRKERCQFLQARVRFFRRGVSKIEKNGQMRMIWSITPRPTANSQSAGAGVPVDRKSVV